MTNNQDAPPSEEGSPVNAGIFTIPNLVSVVRLALIPILWWWMASDRVAAAGWLLGIIGATDWIDGYLARRLNQVSEVGKFLDPLADRIAVAVAVIGGLVFDILPAWFAWAIIIREAIIGVGALAIAARARAKLDVRQLGKLATALLYGSVAWYFVGKGTPFDPLVWLAWATGIPGLILYYVVGYQYLQDALGLLRNASE